MVFYIQSTGVIVYTSWRVSPAETSMEMTAVNDQAMKLDYFFDPFCGWCYASAPALKAVAGANPKDAGENDRALRVGRTLLTRDFRQASRSHSK